MRVAKAHGYGNDFLLVEEAQLASGVDRPSLARRLCDRHYGIGADGLIVYSSPVSPQEARAEVRVAMRLLNADGSRSEVSGNGVRCLAALVAADRPEGTPVVVETEAGEKHLLLLGREGGRLTFRASMGQPVDMQRRVLDVLGAPVEVVTLNMGNPQCVVLGPISEEGLHTTARALATHEAFPEGTNVELADVERPDHVRILIWERGVGPTLASGTGACAAAVAAAAFGDAGRDVLVAAPGGEQRVQWSDAGVMLTGWAEVVFEGQWTGG